jgi:hypothetical protein
MAHILDEELLTPLVPFVPCALRVQQIHFAWYCAGMKATKRDQAPLLKSVVRDSAGAGKNSSRKSPEKPSRGTTPVEPAALYQDAGGGYNSDFTIPQK